MSVLIDMLIRHEGSQTFPYTDTVGKLTVGVGRNLTDNGLSDDEIAYLLNNDVQCVIGELTRTFPWYSQLDAPRQDALADMAFNLGMPRLKGFQYMLDALARKDWVGAAHAALDSKWAEQVGTRATEIASILRTGMYQY